MPMPLFKLRVSASDLAAGRAAADAIGGLVAPQALAVTLFEDRPPAFVIEAYYDGEPARDPIVEVLAAVGAGLGAPTIEALPDTNWVALSQASLAPIAAGRFVVHGSHDRGRFAFRRRAIEIDAGEAFGTGYNATTTLCLEALDELMRRRHFARVLDLGCGTGILPLPPRAPCPRRALAADNDPIATAVARENARLNRLARRVQVLDAAGFGHPLCGGQLSSIWCSPTSARTLIDLAPAMRRAVRPGGVAILSGLLSTSPRSVRRLSRRRLPAHEPTPARRMDRAHAFAPVAVHCRPSRGRLPPVKGREESDALLVATWKAPHASRPPVLSIVVAGANDLNG